jgi:aminoglycoside 2'-N-acetyltransferase I
MMADDRPMTTPVPPPVTIRRATSPELSAADLARLRALFEACWPDGEFTPEDGAHAMGGVHWIAEAGGRIVGHASVVPRTLEAAGRPLATGYVEAVATHPDWRHRGIATRLLRAANDHIRAGFELGGLGTGVHALYERLGWETWAGPTFVRAPGGLERTEDEDGYIMVLRTPATPGDLRGDEPLACDWRPGDAW